jgi:hypothetical protein
MVLVKFQNTPGAAVGPMFIQAGNPFQAIQVAKSMYGSLLLSEYAIPAN